ARLFTGIKQHEQACTVGVLSFTLFKGGLAKECSLLVAENTSNRDFCQRTRCTHMAEAANAGTNFRQNRQRHADFFAQLLIPLQGANIHEQGARSIGDVGEVQSLVALVPACTAGEIPQQPSIDSAGEQLHSRRAHVHLQRCRESTQYSDRQAKGSPEYRCRLTTDPRGGWRVKCAYLATQSRYKRVYQ